MAVSRSQAPEAIVVVGAGLAGAKSAEALRDNGFDGAITLIGSERHLPYERPPLSKDVLTGHKHLADFTVHDSAWYRENKVELRLGQTVNAIDTDTNRVTLADGDTLSYDKLILATGSSSKHPPFPGADAAGVYYLRTVDQAREIKHALTAGSSLAVIGAGWIGLEVAAAARAAGVAVTIVESATLPLQAALGRELGDVFAGLHREHNVDFRFDSSVAEITTTDGRARGLRLSDGTQINADAVLVAVGAAPNIDIAREAGLDIADGGVAVNASLRASDPDVYAVGDIAAAENPFYDTRIRTEHWANALNQPAVAAAAALGGTDVYDTLPYFFTDQYDLGMEYVGYAPSYDSVVIRGDQAKREFVAFWLDADRRVLAGMNVNVWDVTDDVKALIRSRKAVDPIQVADTRTPLSRLG
ncbi:putative ferredoxin reductase [Gordonia effusa NBRC 100432]|uniref:Putative ferredoxin reductase n=1 Tax=Gordonia effusa NBRC 100432 TaxID=1077974 RepID=H0R3Y6_9ACTN|nr:FAD-dependent oxidoreductase [Gordonia effusa]GAB19787.1 putative ferredoxin reductase [Gordonia effusa NBRC 100432]